MRVLDHRPALWFLLEDGEELYLDAYVNKGFMSFSVLFRLDEGERAGYVSARRGFLQHLAAQIQDDLPRYEPRNVVNLRGDDASEAVRKWRT